MTTITEEPTTPPTEAVHALGPKGIAWWGVVVMIMTEAMIFATLLASYFFMRAASKEWPPHPIEPPELEKISIFSVILLGSSGPMFWAEHGIRKGQQWRLRLGLTLVIVMGLVFFANQIMEYRELHFTFRENAYSSLFYGITGLHGAHVVAGLLMLSVVTMKAWLGKFSERRHVTVEVVGLYWHFVDVVWIFVFSSLYLSEHLH
jgi:cytochrome c oxidase subunit 3